MVSHFEKVYYQNIGRGHALSGIDAIKRKFPFFKVKDVEKLLTEIDTYTQQKAARPVKYHNYHYNRTRRKQLSADLIDVSEYKDENDDVTFLLLVMDNFSRYLFIRPLLFKDAVHTKEALESIFDNDMTMPYPDMTFLCDRG